MKLTAYCTVYNHEKYLRSALDGFVNQKTNFDYQVIVHDDCSTDNSAEIIREYAEKYPDIIKPIYQKENQYSKGIKIRDIIKPLVEGDYIAVCEGDDYWCDDTKLQREVDFLDANPDYVACVHDTLQLEMSDGKTFRLCNYGKDMDIPLEKIVAWDCYHTSSLVYRLPYIYYRPPFFEKAKKFGDAPLALYLALNGKIRYIDRVMSVYRHGTMGSWSYRSQTDMKAREESIASFAEMLKGANEYSEYKYDDLFKKYINKCEINSLSFSDNYSALLKKENIKKFKYLSTRERLVVIYRTIFRPLYVARINRLKKQYEKQKF